jgi:hypothetical protein
VSGGSAADAQTIAKDLTIAAKTTHEFIWPDETFVMNAGDFLQGLADTTLKVSARVCVVDLTL